MIIRLLWDPVRPSKKKLAWFGAAETAWVARLDRYWQRAELINLISRTKQLKWF